MSDNDTSFPASKRRTFLKAGAGAVAVSLAGCADDDEGGSNQAGGDTPTEAEPEETPESVDESEEIQRGGDFRFGMSQPPAGLNPLAVSSAYSWQILDLVYEGGTAIDPVTFEVHPWVFTDWTVENTDSGEPDIYFNVREGLTFTDGEELTVDDVIFTFEYLKEHTPGRYAASIEPVAEIEEGDGDWDVHLKLSRPVGTYDTTVLGIPILPQHRWEDIDEFSEYQPHEEGGPVGLGPGEVTQYDPDTAIEVTFRDPEEYKLSNLDWIQNHENLRSGGPFLETARFMIYGSSSALQEAFISEDAIDALYGSVQPARVEDVQSKDGARIVTGFDTGYAHYSFNMRKTPLDDTIFRQALGMAFDNFYWTEQLNRGFEQRGAFVMPPGYEAVRPETGADVEINEHPATKAFDFRGRADAQAVVDAEAVKEFLRNGEPVHGSAGTYAGVEYPGSLTGVEADETEARHEYSWGSVESSVLQSAGVEEEIRINGQTVEEIMGQPLQMLMYPPGDTPLSTQMVENFVGQLHRVGIPIERNVMTFNTMVSKVYRDTDFDIFPMSWTNLSPFATSSLNGLFHSDQAHGEDSAHETLLNNAMGYGLPGLPSADDLIDEALEEMDEEERNSLAQQAVEKIYLDYPTQINSHTISQWPVNEADFAGFIGGIPSPGDSYSMWQFHNVHQSQ